MYGLEKAFAVLNLGSPRTHAVFTDTKVRRPQTVFPTSPSLTPQVGPEHSRPWDSPSVGIVQKAARMSLEGLGGQLVELRLSHLAGCPQLDAKGGV